MAIIEEIVEKAAAAKDRLLARGEAIKACAGERADAAKSCAAERVVAVKACALERVERVSCEANLRFQYTYDSLKIWWLNKAEARAQRKEERRLDKWLYEMECDVKKQDYEIRCKEYRKWRFDQAEIAFRDHFKRMQNLGMIDPKREFPFPLRPDLYAKKPRPMPPKKPLIKSYEAHLESTNKVFRLFDKTVRVALRPAGTIGALVVGIACVCEVYEELQTPGTIIKHVKVVSRIFKREFPKDGEEAGHEFPKDGEEAGRG